MAKYSTYPTLFDEVLQISISKLRELKYLEHNQIKSGTLQWSRNGKEIAKISILVNANAGYIELDYNYNEEPRKYKIDLVSLPSNLGKGKVWYFLCPQTKKRCRVLYLVGGYFLHREAFKGCMYEKQTKSKKGKDTRKLIDMVFSSDKLHEQLYQKHFRRTYAGKATKKYIKIMQKINRVNSLSANEVERLLLPKFYF
jgi:hypothetical protein